MRSVTMSGTPVRAWSGVAVSTLGYALLGLLGRDDLTGYDLSLLLKEPLSFYWHARHSQIYPELAKLERGGFVKHKLVRQSERPDKKIFTLTKSGRAALREWVTSPLRERHARDELVLRVASLWAADKRKVRGLLTDELRQHRALLRRHEKVARDTETRWPQRIAQASNPMFCEYATLRRGIGYEREVVSWLKWTLGRLGDRT